MTEVTTVDPKKAPYLEVLEKSDGHGAPDWIKDVRANGLTRFTELELPHSKLEDWRFTNVSPVTGTAFKPITEPDAKAVSAKDAERFLYPGIDNVAVFVDGFFNAELSKVDGLPKGMTFSSMAGAMANDGALVAEHLDRHASNVGNAYSALNSAILRDGAFIHIAKGAACEAPLHLIFITTGRNETTARFPRVLCVADETSEATVIESYVNLGAEGPYLDDVVAEYVLGQSANFKLYKVIEEGPQGYYLATRRVQQGRDSHFKSYIFNLSGRIGRNELSVKLDGEGASCSLHGLYLPDGDQLIDNHQSITHAVPNCESWIGYKGVLGGKGKAVYTGKILVERDAQKTDSNQLNQNILLSDEAQVDTKPQLEIYADDVKCTHGATIGQFPDKVVHYFQSRGIAPDMALAMLTYGFADEVVQEVEVGPLQEYLERFVFDKYSPK